MKKLQALASNMQRFLTELQETIRTSLDDDLETAVDRLMEVYGVEVDGDIYSMEADDECIQVLATMDSDEIDGIISYLKSAQVEMAKNT